jgi:DNA invertase Pin-like site-specific DNA recombinase
MLRILGYSRVSTDRQEEDGLSLEAQRRRLEEAGVTEVLTDVMSGAKDDRPQFRELMRRVKAREVDGVIVCKLDRLTRSITARAEIYEAFTQPGAPTLRALDDGIDLSTASGRQMFDLLGAIATGERERIRERIKDGLAERERRGLMVGGAPWGLRLTRTGAGVEIDPDLAPTVRQVLRIMEESATFGTAVRRIAAEVGKEKGRSSWRTWLHSPQLAGAVPKGCKHQLKRVYDEVRPGVFESYLTPYEQEQLIAKFTGEARGRKSDYPHPCRKRVKCGSCGRTLQRRNDRQGRPRWLCCSYIHCELRQRTVPLDVALDALTRAAFHFSRERLEWAIALQAAPKQAKPDSREVELEMTLAALRALPQDVVGEAVAKAERELASLRQRTLARQGVETVNLAKAVELLELISDEALQAPGPEQLEQLGNLFQLAGVIVTTKEDPKLIANGRPRLVLDQACAGDKYVDVADLPQIAATGGAFDWKDFAAALQIV